jgi:ferrous iron transport protein A
MTNPRPPQSTNIRKLGELNAGAVARIRSVGGAGQVDGLTSRLLELGFLEGARVEVLHEAPYSRDPIAIRVRGGVIALRRNEANLVEVQLEAVHE